MNDLCPCGSQISYALCCAVFHRGENKPYSAEQLMRSRFSAFYYLTQNTENAVQYLLNTWKPKKAFDHAHESKQLTASAKSQQWQSLRVIQSFEQENTATVEFVAFFTVNDQKKVEQLHERSHFIREHNDWYYESGEMLDDIKLQRNDPCWCGSGKKLKKCHQS